MRRALWVACALGGCGYAPSRSGGDPGDDAGIPARCDWPVERELVFANASRDETLTRFPLLVVLEEGINFEYAVAAADGRDLRFIDSDGTNLPYEIERWTSTGASYVWVAVPAIDARSSTDSIRMRYGNPGADAAQDPAAVWSNGYVGVWHFAEDPTAATELADSSPNPNPGVIPATPPISAAGQIGSALELDGVDDEIAVTSDATLAVTDLTLEAWVNVRSAAGTWATVLEHARDTPDWYGLWRSQTSPGHYHFRWSGTGANVRMDFTTPFVVDGWHYIAGTLDSTRSTAAVFQDGMPAGTNTTPSPATTADGPLTIGRTTTGIEPFPGSLDEVRISSVARSAAWIDAQHASMTNTFVTYGAPAAPPDCD